MSSRGDSDLLADILQAAQRVAEYIAGMTYETFISDTRTQDAVVRNLEIVGEAAKNLSAAVRQAHPDLPWKEMAGVRDRLIHHYSGVNLDIVWVIATYELPAVGARVNAILRSMP